MFSVIYKGLVATFVILCLVSSFFYFLIIRNGVVIDTDLRAMLPNTDTNTLAKRAETRLLNQLSNTVVLLIGGMSPEATIEAANFSNKWLSSHSSLRVEKNALLGRNPEKLFMKMKDYRFHLLTPDQRQLLQNDATDVLLDNAWSSILGPQSWARITTTTEDPLALFDGFVQWLSQINATTNVTQQGNHQLYVKAKMPGWYFTPIYIDTDKQVFHLNSQSNTVAILNQLEKKLKNFRPDIMTLKSGIIFHADEAAQRAQREMTIIGLGSILGIIALFIIAFRSLTPLLLSLTSVLIGCAIAFSFVHYFYSGLHIITLVCGASLIGVSIDYSLHYFCKKYTAAFEHRFDCLHSILPATSLGLLTSVIGYGSLSQAPLPSLNQVALFSVTGLIGAWLFVVVIYPWVEIRETKPLPDFLTQWASFPQYCWKTLRKRHFHPPTLLVALTVLSTVGAILTVKASDDIHILHTPSRTLLEEDKKLNSIIGSYTGNQFFIVTGTTEQLVLQNEEVFLPKLGALVDSGSIAGYLATSRFIPSIARQKSDYNLQKSKLFDASVTGKLGSIPEFMHALGYTNALTTQLGDLFTRSENEYLTGESWPELQASGLEF